MNLELLQAFGVVEIRGSESISLRRYGVPPNGAFDRGSLMLANALVGLPAITAAWELGMANARFRALANGMAAVVGARVAVTVDGHGASSQAAFPVHAGAEIHIGPPDRGARAYLSFREGVVGHVRRLSSANRDETTGPVRVLAGPQAGSFDLIRLVSSTFAVGMASDRVGVRLEGTFQVHDIELPSEPACVGAIQVTGSGDLVILGPDGPTIGGYPKAAVVIDADVDRLAQLRPGEEISFQLVSLEEARAARRERLERIGKLCAALRLGLGG